MLAWKRGADRHCISNRQQLESLETEAACELGDPFAGETLRSCLETLRKEKQMTGTTVVAAATGSGRTHPSAFQRYSPSSASSAPANTA